MNLHTHTPVLSVFEPRGLSVRSVAFCRAQVDDVVGERVDRAPYDLAGRRVDRWDPRLWEAVSARSNLRSLHSLSGRELLNDSVDAGWRLELLAESGDSQLCWDAKGQLRRIEHDDCGRPVAVFESEGASENCVERLGYGGPDNALTNQGGRLIRHDDPAGSLFNSHYGLGGQVIEQSRKFLNALDLPDWPLSLAERDALLEPGDGAVSVWRFGAMGDAIEQIDAVGNRQLFTQTVSGQLKSTRLQLNGQASHDLASDIHYDAQNRIESQTAGNGVVTSQVFGAVDGRLLNLRADNGRLQNLSYTYDPAGNVLSIEDLAQPTRYFANQQIEPLRTFAYDTLYQLIEATGYEAAVANQGPEARAFSTATELSNYTQRYEYDAGGNMQTMTHTGARNHTRTFATARYSNRSLLQTGERPPTEEQIAEGFDANGNLRELSPGQTLRWNVRNQLSDVTPVERESGADDSEVYRYDAAGRRLRKVRVAQAKAVTHMNEVRYLPGLEIRSNSATGETLHVVVAQAGRSEVRVLHWQAGRPADIANDQLRCTLTDHLGSSAMELDQNGQLISQEVYYPYGETAWFAARSEVEAKYKTVRYSGQERDVTGLYYYGLRNYSPRLIRWLSPDPSGSKEGLNLFRMCRNSPLKYRDVSGLNSFDVLNEFEMLQRVKGAQFLARGLENFPPLEQERVRDALTLGIEWVQKVQKDVVNDTEFIKYILQNVVGADYSDVDNDPEGLKSQLLTTFGRVEAFMTRLSASENWKLLLVGGRERDFRGATYMTAVQGNMIMVDRAAINESHLVDLTRTVVHESAHAAPVKGGDLYAHDFWYLTPDLPGSASSEQVENYQFTSLDNSAQMLEGPDEQQMAPLSAMAYRRTIDGLLRTAGEPLSTGPEERRELFKTDAAVRQTIVLRNADSLAVMALQFHKRK